MKLREGLSYSHTNYNTWLQNGHSLLLVATCKDHILQTSCMVQPQSMFGTSRINNEEKRQTHSWILSLDPFLSPNCLGFQGLPKIITRPDRIFMIIWTVLPLLMKDRSKNLQVKSNLSLFGDCPSGTEREISTEHLGTKAT